MKHCKMGNHEAPESEFGPCSRYSDKLLSSCRKCVNENHKAKYRHTIIIDRARIDRNRFQVAAFQAMFNAAKIGGRDNHYALASAMCGSSDDVFGKLPSGSIDKWLEFKNPA